MSKINVPFLKTSSLIFLGYGIGTGTAALELAAFTKSDDNIFQQYAVKGLVIVLVAAVALWYVHKHKEPRH